MIYKVDDKDCLRDCISSGDVHLYCSLECVENAGYFVDAADETQLDASDVWEHPLCEECGYPLKGK